jgi:hypothetical protein
VYAGADVTVRVAWGRFSFPLGFGLAAAVNTVNPGAFDPVTDLRGYVFLGFDSFGSTARADASAVKAAPPQR